MKINKLTLWVCLCITFLVGCSKLFPTSRLFSKVPSQFSGITFNNLIDVFEDDSLNGLEYDVLYNGGGIGIGDFNGDGKQDIFFSGSLVPSKLYLNQGGLKFADITSESGVQTNKWCTGVSVQDVNQDGLSDIYVCVANPGAPAKKRSNLLFINKGNIEGIPRFEEVSQKYGLDDSGFSVQAAFFDYDKDGDLDCYVLTNAMEKLRRNRLTNKRNNGEGPSNDKLYENVGFKNDHPIYKNVNLKSGITKDGHGLGLCITDLDQDGWLDIYCANDFVSNDLIWINNHDGTFTDKSRDFLKHTSFNSMGLDVQDFNNDARPDIYVLDMLPEIEERRKMMVMKTNSEYFRFAEMLGYQDEYVRNVLQLNQGKNDLGDVKFSEIGQFSGIHATDWSWAPLFADFNNDGLKDLVISNGYRRDITNLDYVAYLNKPRDPYGKTEKELRTERNKRLLELPEIKLKNYLYRNKGDLTFEDVSESWGLVEQTYSNGAAYADLDNDGDLDLVFNNIDDEAGIYKNNLISISETQKSSQENSAHYLRIKLKSVGKMNKTVGAKVYVLLKSGQLLYQENLPVRGYMSSVDPILFFGLGKSTSFELKVVWADDKVQIIEGLKVDGFYEINYQPQEKANSQELKTAQIFKQQKTDSLGFTYKHQEFRFDEFKRTPSLHQQYSRNSPGLAIGDVDGNGLDDVFIGADPGFQRCIFLQQKPGMFLKLVQGENNLEDMGSLFFDVDDDGDLDLYVVSGGSLYPKTRNEMYNDRVYLNNGAGIFTRSQNIIPKTLFSGSVVTAADFDNDGDLDIFRGSRVSAGEFPLTPDSYLFRNDDGTYKDVTSELTKGLQKVGMVTSALWTDYNQDGWFDLIVLGEFMPITFFANHKGRLIVDDQVAVSNSEGWWNSINCGDFDQDGDLDYILGNLGLNSQYKAAPGEPLRVYASDFDNNGTVDPILTYHKDGKEVPIAIKDVLHNQLAPIMRKRFKSYAMYSQASIDDVLSRKEISNSQILKAVEMRSCLLKNIGGRKFELNPLPAQAQLSPVFGSLVMDFNGDGFLDALLVGNSDAFDTYTGSVNASMGTLLLGNGQGGFEYVPQNKSGLYLNGDAKSLGYLATGNGSLIIVANNGGVAELIEPINTKSENLPLTSSEVSAKIIFKNGKIQRHEMPFGSGYLSQSSRVLPITKEFVDQIHLYDFSGKSTRVLNMKNGQIN